jgi:hypothetical protein
LLGQGDQGLDICDPADDRLVDEHALAGFEEGPRPFDVEVPVLTHEHAHIDRVDEFIEAAADPVDAERRREGRGVPGRSHRTSVPDRGNGQAVGLVHERREELAVRRIQVDDPNPNHQFLQAQAQSQRAVPVWLIGRVA